MLATCVCQVVRRSYESQDARSVDYRAALVDVRNLRPQAVAQANDVDAVDEIPIIVIHSFDRDDVALLPDDTRKIGTAVQFAEDRNCFGYPVLNFLPLRDVYCECDDFCFRVCLQNLSFQALEALFLDISKGEFGASAREQAGSLLANARSCASDDNDLVLE